MQLNLARSRTRLLVSLASLSIPIAAIGLVTANRLSQHESRSFSRIRSVSGPNVKVGGNAPTIVWKDAATGKEVSLSDLRGKPVMLFH